MVRLPLALACVLSAAALPSSAAAAWHQPVGGLSPINQAGNRDASGPSLAAVGGVPYVAWAEDDGPNNQVRVSRLNAAGTAWEQLVGGPSPINQASDRNAYGASLAAVGGVPYVAWTEYDGTNYELRVSRLNAAGTDWEQVVGGPSPINNATDRSADEPSLAAIGGVPHVAWAESDGTNYEVRVSRLNGNGAFEQLVGGLSPINHASDRSAGEASLAAVGGVPYVAWTEYDGTNYELRVSRLNAAGTAWQQLVGGPSPINNADGPGRDAYGPSLAAIGGVPYVAWSEWDGTNFELRVSRLNAAGTAWVQVVGGPSPINNADDGDSYNPSLTAVGGVPYVAWHEDDELRVSRLNAAGTAWEQLVGGPSPMNDTAGREAARPSLAFIGGVPYVAWREYDYTNYELRVARLEPEFTSQSVTASPTGATLTAGVRTYGIPYRIGFQYGPALASETAIQSAPAGNDHVTISGQVGGLRPSTSYPFRPFATAGVPDPRVLGTIDAFTTIGGGGRGQIAFGSRTLVTLRLAAGRIPAAGPLPVRVTNANGFQVTGTLSGRATKRPIELRARSFKIAAHRRKIVKLRLPMRLRKRLQHRHRLTLRLTARLEDPSGHTRTVSKAVGPRLSP
jgi:hypothetical protein